MAGLKLSLLGEVSTKINSTLDLDQLLTVIMDSAKQMLHSEASSLLLIDEESEDLLFNVAIGDKAAEIKTKVVPKGEGFAGIVAQRGRPILSNNVQEDPRHYKEIDKSAGFETRNIIVVPMMVKDKMVGVLEVLNSVGREEFSQKDLQLLTYLADQAAIAINNRELMSDLQDRVRELSCLYEISQAISYLHNSDELFEIALTKISELMDLERASFLFLDKQTGKMRIRAAIGIDPSQAKDILIDPTEGISGYVLKTGDPLLVRDIEKEKLFENSTLSHYHTRSFLSVPITYQQRVMGVVNVADKRSGQPFTWFDLRLLSTVAGQIVEAYCNIEMEQELLLNRELKKEIEIAAIIQQRTLPRASLQREGFDACARIRMARFVGGDLYAFTELGKGRYGVAIADVSGKSIPAAIFVTILRNYFLSYARENALPGEVMQRVNASLFKDSEAGMFATMAYLICDTRSRLLICSNAGHLPCYLLRHAKDEIEELNARGRPLGILEDSLYEERATMYEPGDLLFLFTDGITEELLPDGEMFGEERLKAFLREQRDATPQQLTDNMMEQLVTLAGDHPPEDDDHTCIAVRL